LTLRQILTARELEYAALVAECCANKEIGKRLGVSASFVKYKLKGIYEKIGIQESQVHARVRLAVLYDRSEARKERNCR